MTIREKLYHLVNALPATEIEAAERRLEYLAQTTDPLELALELAPEDDEPPTDADRAAIAEGLADYRAARGASTEDVRRELRLA